MATYRRSVMLGVGACALVSPEARANQVGIVEIGRGGWLFPHWEDVRRISIRKNQNSLSIIGQAISAIRNSGIQVAILLTPMKARIYADMLPPDFQPNNEFKDSYRTARNEILNFEALVPDVATFLLSERQTTSTLLYFKTDTHWTPIAAERTAAMVAHEILPHLPSAHGQRGATLGPFVSHAQRGDLTEQLPATEQKKYPPDSFEIRSIPAVAGPNFHPDNLLSDVVPDVAIVGNSYMLPYFGFPFAMSNQLNRPVNLSWQTARIGPYRTLLDYLRSNSFKKSRPRLILWQIPEGTLDITPEQVPAWGDAAMPVNTFVSSVRSAVALP